MPNRSFFRKALVMAVSLITLGTAAGGCSGSSAPNAVAPTIGDPLGRIAASPLSILSIAGGNVFVKRSGTSDWTAGKVGMALDPGDSVKTDATGVATVTFFEGSTVELSGTTEVSLTELAVAERTATSIRLKQEIGRTMSRVKKLVDPASRYEIETAAAIAAVRGSMMLVEVTLDGTTTVGNVEGTISVFARGVEIRIPPGQQSVTHPGMPPGQPEALTISPTPVGPATTSATTPPQLVTTPPASVARIAVEKRADRLTAYQGDTVVYTYSVSNAGSAPLSSVSVLDDKAGTAAYQIGDTNGDRALNSGETWIFRAQYVVGGSQVGPLTNTATASGIAQNQTVTAAASLTIEVASLTVKISSVREGDIVGRTLSVGGTVNDPSVRQATLLLNGATRVIPVTNGRFAVAVSLADGTNTIVVTVTKAGGTTASDTLVLEPASTP
jgi:hypothetical protein